jgi:hypothetical protein
MGPFTYTTTYSVSRIFFDPGAVLASAPRMSYQLLMRERESRPHRVAEPLRRLLQRIDPERRLHVYDVWRFWEQEVGESIAARAEPASFRRGVLSVRVSGHAWMQELQFMKETIRDRLNARLGAAMIRDIYFVSGTVTARAKTDAPPPAETRPVTVPRLPRLSDRRLAEVFARLVDAQARVASRGRGSKDGD